MVQNFFAHLDNGSFAGVVGIEVYGTTALLRSFAVNKKSRDNGIGKQLVAFIESHAKSKGMKQLFLLTTTAAEYFAKNNYDRIKRTEVPEEIKRSTEFNSTCPASAIVMKKIIA